MTTNLEELAVRRFDLDDLAKSLSASARRVIEAGDDSEWYASSERVADQIVAVGLGRQPFTYDRLVVVPNVLGLALRNHLENRNG